MSTEDLTETQFTNNNNEDKRVEYNIINKRVFRF